MPARESEASGSKAIVTVTGLLDPCLLGPTLAHEHLYSDLSAHSGKADNVLTDVSRSVDELKHLRAVGGEAVIEVTPEGVGRDPAQLRRISEGSGITIVSGIAFYLESTYPSWARSSADGPVNVDRLADYFVHQIEEGQAGVRAGIIGEIASHNAPGGTSTEYRLDDAEAVLFTAAAQAQRRSGAGIITHAALGRGGHAQLRLLEQAGAVAGRVCIGHCDAEWRSDPQDDLAYYLPILERGAFCAFDLIGWTELAPDDIRADRIAALIGLGYEQQILLGTDTCRQSQLHVNGGRGYDYLWRSFLPRLRARGVAEEQIRSMMVIGPRRLLTLT
jgi:predicted metal-dependent phosphotriesterase family hydrolase